MSDDWSGFEVIHGGRERRSPRSRDLPPFSDEAMALGFAARHAEDLRYVAKLHQWRQFQGHRYIEDTTLHVFDLVRAHGRHLAEDADGRDAKEIASKVKTAAVEFLARTDRRLATAIDDWDGDPWLLNTPSGPYDLRRGELLPVSPANLLTKSTAVAPGGDCPTWLTFLNDITGGDAELIAYLQRLAGYALTGSTREHALLFLYGQGGNGKSVFVSTLAGVLGDYHVTAPIETFTVSDSDRHPTEIAMLHGARLVTSVETEEGRRWAESRIKQLTGGDRVRARFMRQDFFEFMPQFKLLIAGNHKPALRTVDAAIRRRFHLVPFTVQIPLEEQDDTLPDRLKPEWPGILRWMLDGCTAWQRDGLAAPAAVTSATEAYLDNQDAVAAWLAERCDLTDPEWFTGGADAFHDWKHWASTRGEFVLPRPRLADALERHGVRQHRTEAARGFLGLRLKP